MSNFFQQCTGGKTNPPLFTNNTANKNPFQQNKNPSNPPPSSSSQGNSTNLFNQNSNNQNTAQTGDNTSNPFNKQQTNKTENPQNPSSTSNNMNSNSKNLFTGGDAGKVQGNPFGNKEETNKNPITGTTLGNNKNTTTNDSKNNPTTMPDNPFSQNNQTTTPNITTTTNTQNNQSSKDEPKNLFNNNSAGGSSTTANNNSGGNTNQGTANNTGGTTNLFNNNAGNSGGNTNQGTTSNSGGTTNLFNNSAGGSQNLSSNMGVNKDTVKPKNQWQGKLKSTSLAILIDEWRDQFRDIYTELGEVAKQLRDLHSETRQAHFHIYHNFKILRPIFRHDPDQINHRLDSIETQQKQVLAALKNISREMVANNNDVHPITEHLRDYSFCRKKLIRNLDDYEGVWTDPVHEQLRAIMSNLSLVEQQISHLYTQIDQKFIHHN